MINKIRKNSFYRLDFDEKQDKLDRYLLNLKDCKIGQTILCFEDREITYETYEISSVRLTRKEPKKLLSFTVGKHYTILDTKRRGEIKIKGDSGRLVWTTRKRFLGQKALRAIKLKELEKLNKKINFLTE